MVERAVSFVAICAICLAATAASAQTPAPDPAPAPLTRPLHVERVEDGYVIAPEARVTDLDGRTGALAGVYGGWLADRTLLVGAGGYWLANRDDDYMLWYGGLVVEWLVRSEERIGFGVRGLAGGGSATLGSSLASLTGTSPDGLVTLPGHAGGRQRGHGGFRPGPGLPGDTVVLVSESFFAVEPQASLVWHVTRWCQVNIGAGYRVTAGADHLDDRLRGASGSLAVQFGGGR